MIGGKYSCQVSREEKITRSERCLKINFFSKNRCSDSRNSVVAVVVLFLQPRGDILLKDTLYKSVETNGHGSESG